MSQHGRSGGIHPDDDTAHNIRRAQQRDAMPSRHEKKSAHNDFLRESGCTDCDERDAANLNLVSPLETNCSAAQKRQGPGVVYCDDCLEDRETLRERALRRARSQDGVVAVAFYDCQSWKYVNEVTEPEYPGHVPTTNVQCRCGEYLDEVVPLSEADSE